MPFVSAVHTHTGRGLMTSSLQAQRLAYDLLGEFVELLSIFPPHFGGIDVRSALIVGLWRRGEDRVRR